ncbi:phage tail sheath C-terminal domain-containing protein [Pleomorphomonas sp. NRK KF1]|uniref:phage tail sheath family protein n=1 Tax=Pleomorphomonas sp. NRK KF1 TaxID=2943000 RepID=UPI0020436F59|nr:phage tail sheath C-terminal domain-containing protein [Pleomorphomonas sp. NRK KF1]MCM5555577.1 phage tail sheath subtilisin-like domain-containing protein [Pleomorphomonas sp. NRK KF1]
MSEAKKPGIHIAEPSVAPSAVLQAPTAVPAFVGHTEKFGDGAFKPKRITSQAEYERAFGKGAIPRFAIVEKTDPTATTDFQLSDANGKLVDHVLEQPVGAAGGRYLLYNAIRLFYRNGGGLCYIVPVGDYEHDFDSSLFQRGFDALCQEEEPAMLVVPEAVSLEPLACFDLQQRMLAHCGAVKNRFAILDVWGGDKPRSAPDGDPVERFRQGIGTQFLDYGAAYYPWVNTTLFEATDLGEKNVISGRFLQRSPKEASTIARAMLEKLNCMPPSAALAGIYATIDAQRGVWGTPANVALAGVSLPTTPVSVDEQEDLNTPVSGKAVNTIRAFVNEGTLVWGARTLDGNSQHNRYINMRRTRMMLEQTVRQALKAYAFDPNTPETWIAVKDALRTFLTEIWTLGGLAGAKPSEAFDVRCGLDETMTSDDVVGKALRVSVLIAPTSPADFIEMTFEQRMR